MTGYLITLAMIGIIVGLTEKRSEVVGLRVYSLMATAQKIFSWESNLRRQRSGMAKAKGQEEDRARWVTNEIPIVEVTAPDGRMSLWAAAVARNDAVAALAEVIPADHVATLSRHRLTLSRRSDGFRPGEVRRIRL
jgi:hypothetical protein